MPYPGVMASIRLPHSVVVPEREIEFRASRSSGPGGQHANTTDSQVELRWSVATSSALDERQRSRLLERLATRLTSDGVLILRTSEHRSQHRNRDALVARFTSIVGEALTPPTPRRPTRPSRGAKQRRRQAKAHRSEVKRLRRRPEA